MSVHPGTEPTKYTSDEIWIQNIESGGFFCRKDTFKEAHEWCKQAYVRGHFRTVRVDVTRMTCCHHIVEFGIPTPLDRP